MTEASFVSHVRLQPTTVWVLGSRQNPRNVFQQVKYRRRRYSMASRPPSGTEVRCWGMFDMVSQRKFQAWFELSFLLHVAARTPSRVAFLNLMHRPTFLGVKVSQLYADACSCLPEGEAETFKSSMGVYLVHGSALFGISGSVFWVKLARMHYSVLISVRIIEV